MTPYLIMIGAGVVFLSDLIGNLISFNRRITNAFVTGIVWAVLFTAILFLAMNPPASSFFVLPSGNSWLLKVVGLGALIVFVSDLIGNTLSFDNRFFNAVVTAIVWTGIFTAMDWFRTFERLGIL